jgi:predicted Zn-dependent peptidase
MNISTDAEHPTEWRTTRLANGIAVLQLARPEATPFSIVLAVPAGTRTEQPGQSGISHFLEHCYALGTPRFGPAVIDGILESHRGCRGALTTHDCTIHFATLAPEAMETFLDMEADRLANLNLPADEVGIQRAIVLRERQQRTETSPAGALVHRLLAAAYQHHPYGTAVVGRQDDVLGLTPEQLLAYYRRHYVPSNIAFVIAGGGDPDRTLGLFERYFAQLPAGIPHTDAPVAEPAQTGSSRETFHHPGATAPRLAMLWKVPPLDHADTSSLLVLERLLLSALPVLQGGHWRYRDHGPFILATSTDDHSPHEAVEMACDALLDSLGRRGPDIAELDAARAAAARRLPDPLREQINLACGLSQFQVTSAAGAARVTQLLDGIARVTPDDIERCARQYLCPEKKTVVTMLPS